MSWTKSEMVARYQHLMTDDVRSGIADRVGALLWDTVDKPESPRKAS